MEYVKNNIYNKFNLDKLKLRKGNLFNSIKLGLKEHKIITLALSLFLILSAVNAFMIYNFMVILKNI